MLILRDLQVKGRSDHIGSIILREQMYWWVCSNLKNSISLFFAAQIFVVDSADMMRMEETGEVCCVCMCVHACVCVCVCVCVCFEQSFLCIYLYMYSTVYIVCILCDCISVYIICTCHQFLCVMHSVYNNSVPKHTRLTLKAVFSLSRS